MSNIRTAKQEDLESITEIYNQAINSKFETAETKEVNVVDRLNWFSNHTPDTYPIFVYEKDGKILGWLSFSSYREGRTSLRATIEISYYVHREFKRQGIGSKLVEHALDIAPKMGCKNIFGIILDKNEPSIRLMYKYGFVEWGHLPNIANFDGEECGHMYLGRRL
jgi:phosphinothricin acetyltransferase